MFIDRSHRRRGAGNECLLRGRPSRITSKTQVGNRSAAAVAQLHKSQPSVQINYLKSLSIYVSLKRSEHLTRVQKSTVDKYSSFVEAFTTVYDQLLCKQGLREYAKTTHPLRIMGIDDYIEALGNPLTNGDSITSGLVGERCELLVITSRSLDEGRFSLDSIVKEAGGGYTDARLQGLASLKVDDLEVCKKVKHIVSEYVSRQRLRSEVQGRKRLLVKSEQGGQDDDDDADGVTSEVSRLAPSAELAGSSMASDGPHSTAT